MSANSLFSEHWHRVSELAPQPAADVDICRHVYRLQPHYIIRRASTRQWHRLTAEAYALVKQFNGFNTVDQIWQKSLRQQGESAISQGELIQLLAQLHEADLITVNSQLDTAQLISRHRRMEAQDSRQRYWNPLFIRFRLFDPNRLLTTMSRYTGWLFHSAVLMCFLMLGVAAIVTLAPRWNELQTALSSGGLFDPLKMLTVALLYPCMKVLHEIGHGLVLKRFGGEVRECGVAFLVLIPNPYIDASAASAFPAKRERIAVSAAGILVELALAALATLIWAHSTGMTQDVALCVMLIGSASTLLFNGNPLLKFDGYFMLADWLEIPNLAQRSRTYLTGTLCRWFGGNDDHRPSPVDARERLWLIGYGLLSSAYRIVLMISIAWFISGQYFFFGALLAAWAGLSLFVFPAWKGLQYLSHQPASVRHRALGATGALFVITATATAGIPLPNRVLADGIIWLPEQSVLRTQEPCQVETVHTAPGSHVTAGTPLFDCANAELSTLVAKMSGQLSRLQAESAGLLLEDPVEHQKLLNSEKTLQSEYQRTLDKLASLAVVAPGDGQFLIEGTTELEGRHFPANATAGFVVPDNKRTVRVALTEAQAGSLTGRLQDATLRLAGSGQDARPLTTRVIRQTPKATHTLPSAALTTLGGGTHQAEAGSTGPILKNPAIDLELLWPDSENSPYIGTRLRVRLDSEPTPLASRWLGYLQRALIERFTS